MAKRNTTPIGQADIEEYLTENSDFAFELQVKKRLSDFGYQCSHCGIYEDPVSKKSREYDIRALYTGHYVTLPSRIHLAVEAKNIRENYPLVVHCSPAAAETRFHEVVVSSYEAGNILHSAERDVPSPLYLHKFVGQSTDQVGRTPGGEITRADKDVFDRVSQAIHSAHGLLANILTLRELPVRRLSVRCS